MLVMFRMHPSGAAIIKRVHMLGTLIYLYRDTRIYLARIYVGAPVFYRGHPYV